MNCFKSLRFWVGLTIGIIVVFFVFAPSVISINKIKNLENTVVAQAEIIRRQGIETESLKHFTTNGYKNNKIQDMKDGDIGWVSGALIVGDSAFIRINTFISNKYNGEYPIMVVKESHCFFVDFTYVDINEIKDRKYSLHPTRVAQWNVLRILYIGAFITEMR